LPGSGAKGASTRAWVLACFDPRWPVLNYAVACFAVEYGSSLRLFGGKMSQQGPAPPPSRPIFGFWGCAAVAIVCLTVICIAAIVAPMFMAPQALQSIFGR
jgi:hypothetical protein